MTSLRIRVERPVKTDDTYVFKARVGDATPGRTLLARLSGARGREIRFGFRADNFTIRHSALWDSVLPLFFLTRYGGPAYDRGVDRCEIRFNYPVLDPVARFFERRAANLGFEAVVVADTFERTFDLPTQGRQVALGGGKDSRLLVGLLRELGEAPSVSTAGRANWPPDLPDALRHEPVNGLLSERLMPCLMSGYAELYLGSAIGAASLTVPWHRYYDWSAPPAQGELSDLLKSLGVDLSLYGPTCVLPANLIQKILHRRYPELCAHQRSVAPGARKEKQLHISLMQLLHGMSIADHCPDEVFRSCLSDFMTEALRHAWGPETSPQAVRRLLRSEMMAMIHRLRDHPLLSEVRDTVPADWDTDWIDGVHSYVDRRVGPDMLDIFHQYAPEYVLRPGGVMVPIAG